MVVRVHAPPTGRAGLLAALASMRSSAAEAQQPAPRSVNPPGLTRPAGYTHVVVSAVVARDRGRRPAAAGREQVAATETARVDGGSLTRSSTIPMGNAAAILALLAGLAAAPNAAFAQRAAVPDDFPGLTRCEGGRAVTRIRADVRDSLLQAQLEAHEAVHRAQAEAFPDCESFLGTLTSARRIIDVELPAYCAQWRVAVGQGADPAETRREYAWRIAAQSGAMENRLDVAQRFDRECPLSVSGSPRSAPADSGSTRN